MRSRVVGGKVVPQQRVSDKISRQVDLFCDSIRTVGKSNYDAIRTLLENVVIGTCKFPFTISTSDTGKPSLSFDVCFESDHHDIGFPYDSGRERSVFSGAEQKAAHASLGALSNGIVRVLDAIVRLSTYDNDISNEVIQLKIYFSLLHTISQQSLLDQWTIQDSSSELGRIEELLKDDSFGFSPESSEVEQTDLGFQSPAVPSSIRKRRLEDLVSPESSRLRTNEGYSRPSKGIGGEDSLPTASSAPISSGFLSGYSGISRSRASSDADSQYSRESGGTSATGASHISRFSKAIRRRSSVAVDSPISSPPIKSSKLIANKSISQHIELLVPSLLSEGETCLAAAKAMQIASIAVAASIRVTEQVQKASSIARAVASEIESLLEQACETLAECEDRRTHAEHVMEDIRKRYANSPSPSTSQKGGLQRHFEAAMSSAQIARNASKAAHSRCVAMGGLLDLFVNFAAVAGTATVRARASLQRLLVRSVAAADGAGTRFVFARTRSALLAARARLTVSASLQALEDRENSFGSVVGSNDAPGLQSAIAKQKQGLQLDMDVLDRILFSSKSSSPSEVIQTKESQAHSILPLSSSSSFHNSIELQFALDSMIQARSNLGQAVSACPSELRQVLQQRLSVLQTAAKGAQDGSLNNYVATETPIGIFSTALVDSLDPTKMWSRMELGACVTGSIRDPSVAPQTWKSIGVGPSSLKSQASSATNASTAPLSKALSVLPPAIRHIPHVTVSVAGPLRLALKSIGEASQSSSASTLNSLCLVFLRSFGTLVWSQGHLSHAFSLPVVTESPASVGGKMNLTLASPHFISTSTSVNSPSSSTTPSPVPNSSAPSGINKGMQPPTFVGPLQSNFASASIRTPSPSIPPRHTVGRYHHGRSLLSHFATDLSPRTPSLPVAPSLDSSKSLSLGDNSPRTQKLSQARVSFYSLHRSSYDQKESLHTFSLFSSSYVSSALPAQYCLPIIEAFGGPAPSGAVFSELLSKLESLVSASFFDDGGLLCSNDAIPLDDAGVEINVDDPLSTVTSKEEDELECLYDENVESKLFSPLEHSTQTPSVSHHVEEELVLSDTNNSEIDLRVGEHLNASKLEDKDSKSTEESEDDTDDSDVDSESDGGDSPVIGSLVLRTAVNIVRKIFN